MKNKKTKRSKVKHPALIKKFNSRVRQIEIDYDYLDKLSSEELDWLNKFSDEYIGASFNNDGTDIDQTPEGRKAAYDKNNARNRCLLGQIQSKVANTKLLNYDTVINMVEEELSKEINPSRIEDVYLDYLEGESLKEFIEEYDMAMSKFNGDEEH